MSGKKSVDWVKPVSNKLLFITNLFKVIIQKYIPNKVNIPLLYEKTPWCTYWKKYKLYTGSVIPSLFFIIKILIAPKLPLIL